MNIGSIAVTNSKGQIVIPQGIRKALNISPGKLLNLVLRGGGLYIYPVDEVITPVESDDSYLQILKATQGSWANDDWPETKARRARIEKEASKKRRQAW